jgi:hypothetical protein
VNLRPVQSSNISKIGYDPETQLMEVHFKNGTRYRYAKVPPEDHEKFVGADSIGTHFHQHIRSRFEGVKLTEET